MELNPNEFNRILNAFLNSWPLSRVQNMSIEEYSNLSDHDSFCYWLEYGSSKLGAIGDNPLTKFELWRPKDEKDFTWYKSDGTYAWNGKKGLTRDEAFNKIRALIIQIIDCSQSGNWEAINTISFHSISKWKIAFLYSNKKLLPIYSKRALFAITKGLGYEFPDNTSISYLQNAILQHRNKDESIEDFAHRVYGQFAQKKNKRKFYIIGSKYDDVPQIDEFKKNKCIAIGFLDWVDFSPYMGTDKDTVNKIVFDNWKEKKPACYKIQRYFRLLSQIKPGDIIAVKSHGTHNGLTIIAYAEVVQRNGSIYEHKEDLLGHHIHVEFLDMGFYKPLGLTYAETIHQLTPKKDGERFYKVFGWYVGSEAIIADIELDEPAESNSGNDGDYNAKTESSFERGPIASVTVNLVHNRIQNKFIQYLQNNFADDRCTGERNRIDAKRESVNEVFIYEIKPFESVYYCIREGIGQLLDYSFQYKSNKQKHIAIVGPNQPTESDLLFINAIKATIQIPFKYLAFNEKELSVSEY